MKNKTVKKCALICIFIILLLMIQQQIYSRFVFQQKVQVEINYKAVKIKDEEIIISPQEWTDKVKVTITSSETSCNIQYKIGEEGSWQNYSEEGFEVTENTTIYARLVYKNLGYADQVMPETSKEITNIDKTSPEVSVSQTRLADVVSIGDYVAYDATSGGGYTYTTDSTLTGASETSTYSSSDSMKWKVLSIDKESGIVQLMAEKPTTNEVTFYGKTGYENAETVLNDIGAVYGHGEGAISGKSITVEDINKLEGYTPSEDGTTYVYTSGTFINEDGTETEATENSPVTVGYTENTADKSTNKYYNYATNNFTGKDFWIASQMIYIEYRENESGRRAIYMLRFMESGSVANVSKGDLFTSKGTQTKQSRAVLPIVTLQTNIQTTGKDQSGAWTIQGERTIKGTAKDGESGVVAYQYSKDGTLTSTSEGWTTVEKTAELEAPEYEIGDYGTYYFYAKDEVGNISKAEIKTGKIIASLKIGENTTYHTSIQDAIINAESDEVTVTLLENTVEENISTNRNVVFNLNGNMLCTKIISNRGILTIKDSLKTGKIYSNSTYRLIHNLSKGILNIESGKIENGGCSNSGIVNISGGIMKVEKSYLWSNSNTINITGGILEGYTSCLSNSSGNAYIQGGLLKSTSSSAISISSGTVNLGVKDGKVNTSVPIIQSKQIGIQITDGATLNFYDGIVKGVTSAISGTVADKEDLYEIEDGTETIDGETYKTAYLDFKKYRIIYNTNYNLVSNGDFSKGTTDWDKNFYSQYAVDTSKKYNELNSLKISSSTNATFDGILHNKVTIKPDTLYKQSVKAYSDGGLSADRPFRVYFDERTSSDALTDYRYYIRYDDTTEKNTWIESKAYYRSDKTADYCIPRADFHNTSNTAGHIWLADIKLEEIARQDAKVLSDTLGTLPTPTRTGYTFLGWYTAPTGGTKIESTNTVTGNAEYYAHWEAINYTITYNTNYNYISNADFSNGTTNWNKNTTTTTLAVDTSQKYNGLNSLKISSSAKAYDGILHSNVSLKANTRYKVSVAAYNNGSIPSNRTFRVYFEEFSSSNSRLNYRHYINYNSSSYFVNTWRRQTTYYTTDANASYCVPRADFSSDDSTAASIWVTDIRLEEISRQDTKIYDDTLGTLPTPTRAGYTFLGWYTAETGGTKIESTNTVTGNIEYYAHWQQSTSNTALTTNEESINEEILEDTNVLEETKEDVVINNQTVEAKTNTETKESVKYTILYNLDGGELSIENPTEYTTETEDIILNNPTKKGYIFDGWTGTDLTDPTKDVVISKGSVGERTYTANWKKDEDAIINDITEENVEIKKQSEIVN